MTNGDWDVKGKPAGSPQVSGVHNSANPENTKPADDEILSPEMTRFREEWRAGRAEGA